jgi:hypothetical protein
MKKVIVLSLLTIASLTLTGFNLSNNKVSNTNTNTNTNTTKTNSIPTQPFCPSGEVIEYSNNNNIYMTDHCGICRLGALYEKNGIKVCTYCSNK